MLDIQELLTDFNGNEDFFFLKNKIKMADSKKNAFFKIANSQYFFVKISSIGPWVSGIE